MRAIDATHFKSMSMSITYLQFILPHLISCLHILSGVCMRACYYLGGRVQKYSFIVTTTSLNINLHLMEELLEI